MSEVLVIHKFDLGTLTQMHQTDKTKLPTLLELTVKTKEIVRWLDFTVENAHPIVWALVKKESELADRKLKVIPTGLVINDTPAERLVYIGTKVDSKWRQVWHMFEILPAK